VAPSVPGDVAAAAEAGRVAVSWSPSTDNVGVAGYTVRRDGAVVATVTSGTSYVDTQVAAGASYRYTVQAFDAAGNTSAQSGAVSATVPEDPPPPSDAGIALRGVATGSNAATTSVTVPAPANATGDLLLATVDVRGTPVVSPPAGWTLLRTDSAGTAIRKATYWRIANASEPASYTWTFNKAQNGVGTILAYDGVSPTAPIEASSGQGNASSTSITAPSVTTESPNSLVVGLFGLAKRASIAPATGMTERSEIATAAGITPVATGETADEFHSQPGPTGPEVATASSGAANIGQLVALTPSTG
jgi:hypothetical protein